MPAHALDFSIALSNNERTRPIIEGRHNPRALESYVSPGSPNSALQGLLALTLDPHDPFWTAVEGPLPVESVPVDDTQSQHQFQENSACQRIFFLTRPERASSSSGQKI